MTIKERLLADLTASMKARDAQRTSVLRMLKAKLLEAEVEQRAAHGLDYQLPDPELIRVLTSYAKQRRDSVTAYRQGGREDLAAQEERELAIVEEYLPRGLTEDEVREGVRAVIAELGATSKKELGAVMKAAMARFGGAADGKLVNRIAGELLA